MNSDRLRVNGYETVRKIKDNVHLVNYNKTCHLTARIVNLDETKDEDLESLTRGICWTRKIRHKNILPFLTTFVDHSNLWIISPHCDLGSASDLSQPAGLQEKVIAYIIRDTLQALQYLHDRGFIHRGICGSHILVCSDGRCQLTGLKYSTNVIKDGRWRVAVHDYPNNAHNNLNWFSPELLEQNLLGYDHKTDIYSLGVTCCELANGVIPYSNLEATKMLLDKLTGNHPKPIDSTCFQFVGSGHELTQDQREKVEAYQNRTFSRSFHSFVLDSCLPDDRHKRPTATVLLNHKFIKQAKNSSNFSALLSAIVSKQQKKSNEGEHSDKSQANGNSIYNHERRNSQSPNGVRKDGSMTATTGDVTWIF